MIVFDARKLGGYDVFLHNLGSSLYNRHSLPNAVFSGGLAAVFAYEPIATSWLRQSMIQATAYFGGISFIVGFTVVYRSQISYSRYNEAQKAYFDMASKLHDFVALANAFLTGQDKKSKKVRSTLIRWCRAYHEIAVEEFQGIEFGTQNRTHLTEEESKLLARDRKRAIQVSTWMQRLMIEHRDTFKVGDAIMSRAFQIQSEANLFFNATRRIAETPFPFPFVQLTAMMINVCMILTPIMVGAFFPESYGIAFLVAAASTWVLFAVNETAAQLEDPFDVSANNLPVVFYSIAFEDDMSAIKYMEYPAVFQRLQESTSDHGEDGVAKEVPPASKRGSPPEPQAPPLHATRPTPMRLAQAPVPVPHEKGEKLPKTPPKSIPARSLSDPEALGALRETESSDKLSELRIGSSGMVQTRWGSQDSTSRDHLLQSFRLRNHNEAPRLGEAAGSAHRAQNAVSFLARASSSRSETNSATVGLESKPAASPSGGSGGATSPGSAGGANLGRSDVFSLFDLDRPAPTAQPRDHERASRPARSHSVEKASNRVSDAEAVGSAAAGGGAAATSRHAARLAARENARASGGRWGNVNDDSVLDMLGSSRNAVRRESSEGLLPEEELAKVDAMDQSAILYHTVHGADGAKMARALQQEREAQRRLVASRALVMRNRLTEHRHDMRRHIFHVTSISSHAPDPGAHRPKNLKKRTENGDSWGSGNWKQRAIGKSASCDDFAQQPAGQGAWMPTESTLQSRTRGVSTGSHETVGSTSTAGEMERVGDTIVEIEVRDSDNRDDPTEKGDREELPGRSRSRRRKKSRATPDVDIVSYPGWTTESLAQARGRGVFQVFG